MEWTRTSERSLVAADQGRQLGLRVRLNSIAPVGFRRRRRAIRRRRNKARLLKTCLVLGWVAGLGGAATIISVEFVGLR